MSRWLQQEVGPNYPDVEILEVLEAVSGSMMVDAETCNNWVSTNSLTHPVLRDSGASDSVGKALGLQVKNAIIVDRNLKIAYKGPSTTTFDQNKLLTTLGQLK